MIIRISNSGLSCPAESILLMLRLFVLFKAGRGTSAKPTEEGPRGAKFDFAEQIRREDLESGEKPDASRTQAFQAEHLSPICQTEMVAEALEIRQADGGARRRCTRGNCPMSFNEVKLQGKVMWIVCCDHNTFLEITLLQVQESEHY